MQGKSILYLGNKLIEKGKNPTGIDTLAPLLTSEGYIVHTSSEKKYKIPRILDMLFSVFKYRNNINYILIDTYSTSAFWYAYFTAKLAKKYSIPYIPILHGGDLPKRYFKSKTYVLEILNNAYDIVSPSNYLFDFFNDKGIEKITKIPNALEIKHYPFKQRKHIKPNILWVRAFAKIYNPILALKALRLLLIKNPSATLCMVGPVKDDCYEECVAYAKKHDLPVEFKRKLTKKEWIEYAEGFDIFLNTTEVDNTPVSVIEAMALGMLVISTNVGGIPHLITHNYNGLLVKPNDENEISSQFETLISNETLAQQVSKQARLSAMQYSWEQARLLWDEILK